MFSFREMTTADDEAVAALVRINLEKAGLNIPGTAYYDEALDHLSCIYGHDSSRYYVLTDENEKIVGGIGFSRFEPMEDTAELQKLYLDDTVKGSGLGYQMIDYIEERMREAGFEYAYLETHDELKAALHIYRKSGYQEIERPKEVRAQYDEPLLH